MKIITKIFFTIVVFVFLSVGFLFIMATWAIPFHNNNLRIFQKHFQKLTVYHPFESRHLSSISDFGNFGNSNHCDYMVGEFRATQLSEEIILKKYEGLSVASFDNRTIPVEVYFSDDGVFKHFPWSDWLNLLSEKPSSTEKVYIIFAFIDGDSPDGDLRCH